MKKSGISIDTVTKMGKDGFFVSSDVLVKICNAFWCIFNEIMELCLTISNLEIAL